MSLEGKTAIIAGGGRDIGRACAIELANRGANVAIAYHASSSGAETAMAEIKAGGGEAIAVQADLTNEADVGRLVLETQSAFGEAIHILVHVTGGLIARKTIADMDLDHWRKVMDLNLTSNFLTVKTVAPHMPDGSAIVNFASQAGRDGGGPGAVAYGTSKGAVMTFTRGLAKEFGPRIRVNAVCPGMIDTTFHDTFTKPEVRKNVAAASLVKREGTSEDVAKLTAFLASDEAAFITGACYDINGGTFFS